MVAKAAQTGHETAPRPSTSNGATPPQSAARSKPVTTHIIEPVQDDPELQALLSSFENSARRARLADGGGTGRAAKDDAHPPAPEREEDLPTIPVFKKSTVEVYRRATDGTMQRVKR